MKLINSMYVIMLGGNYMRTFVLTDEQEKMLKDFELKHECNLTHRSCCGGHVSIIFTPTSIGMVIKAECTCGKKIKLKEL